MFTDIRRGISCLGVLNQVEPGTSWVMGLHYHIHGHECNEGRCMHHVNSYSREILLKQKNSLYVVYGLYWVLLHQFGVGNVVARFQDCKS